MTDKTINIHNAKIHCGNKGNRAYLTELFPDFCESSLLEIEQMSHNEGYSKIIAKVKSCHKEIFEQHDYKCEAFFPLTDGNKVSFMAKYLKKDRLAVKNGFIISDVLKEAENKFIRSHETDMQVRRLENKDAKELSNLYQAVFDSYPFPINDPDYLKETMAQNIRYFGVFSCEKLIAAASAETDRNMDYAEMSDFATLEQYRRLGLAGVLNSKLEKSLLSDGVNCFYTIARSISYGMNKTFAGCGYTFTGTLFNNTNIGGGIESMNVWYKHA